MISQVTISNFFVVNAHYTSRPGGKPKTICLVMKNLRFGEVKRFWMEDGLLGPVTLLGPDDYCICFNAIPKLKCLLSLGLSLPSRVLDLRVELRNLLNGNEGDMIIGLGQAMRHFGLEIDFGNINSTRKLAIRGGAYTPEEKVAILASCENEVQATAELFEKMRDLVSLDHAIHRGRYLLAAARVEDVGLPIDTETYNTLTDHWSVIRIREMEEIDVRFGLLQDGVFKVELLTALTRRLIINWPGTRLGGTARIDDNALEKVSRIHPKLNGIKKLVKWARQPNAPQICVGPDNRNRIHAEPFAARSGRNQPKNGWIWGWEPFWRGLVQPIPGTAIVTIDYAQEEFGIGAALSGDQAMMDAYTSDDPYLAFAKQAGVVPDNATKETHPRERELCKTTALGVLYGMGVETLATRLAISIPRAMALLQAHRLTYRTFWAWSDAYVNNGLLQGRVRSRMDWGMNVHSHTKLTTILNYPMQANGAEILRLATIMAVESGVKVISMVHDALVIEVPIDKLHEHIDLTKTAMLEAGQAILSGFILKVDTEVVKYPNRCLPAKGKIMWNRIASIIGPDFPTAPTRQGDEI